MEKIKGLIFAAVAVVGFAFLPLVALAQETVPSGDYGNCVSYVAEENPIKSALGVGFLVVLVIFGFLKKSFPSAIKDFAIKLLGGSSNKP